MLPNIATYSYDAELVAHLDRIAEKFWLTNHSARDRIVFSKTFDAIRVTCPAYRSGYDALIAASAEHRACCLDDELSDFEGSPEAAERNVLISRDRDAWLRLADSLRA